MARQKKAERESESKQVLKAEPEKAEPLTGEELVSKVKELGSLSKEEKAKACGYYITIKDGVQRVNMMQFLNALIDAKEIELDGNPKTGGRDASYQVAVQGEENREGWNGFDIPFWKRIASIGAQIPEEAWESLPKDMSRNGEHYLYGTPKEE